MRPHALQMTAFGPFAGTVAVDLDALAASGLFLLHGATGAGKTTLLDGIGFALFGRVPGARNDAKRLRSDHAAAGVRPEVRLEATCGGRRIRITRSPAWERPKTRGAGTTAEQARVLLEEHVGGEWVTLSTRPREADDEIADLVGMSADQFFQVVLLPQGEFARFLRAPSVDRVKLLEKLFSTERFSDVEAWLAARRRMCGERVAAARDVVARVVARLGEAAGTAEVPEVPAVGWAAQLLTDAAAAEAAAAAGVAQAEAVRDARRGAAEEALRLAELQQRRAGALERQAALATGRPARHLLQVELDAAVRAAEVAPVLAAVEVRRHRRDAALAVQATSRSALSSVELSCDASVAELRAAAASARAASGRLEGLRAVDVARLAAVDEGAQARAEQADALADIASAELESAALPQRWEQAQAGLVAARAAAAEVPELRARRDQLASLRPEVVALGQARAKVAVLQEEHLVRRETALALEVKAHELRVASVNSMIAVLAFRLEDGVPCDVCGSVVHPDPSQLRDEGVSSEDEERARREAEQAQDAVADVQARLAAEQARCEELSSRVGAWTLAALDSQLADLELELDVFVASAARAAAWEREVSDLDGVRARLAQRQVAAAARADAAARRALEADARAAVAQAELETALGSDVTVDEALQRVARVVSTSEAAAVAAEVLLAAQGELDEAQVTADAAAVAAGFPGVDEAAAAVRDGSWRDDAAVRLREAADLAAAVAAELADPALDVDLDTPAPVAETAELLGAADAELGALLSVLGERRQRRVALERLVPDLSAALAALEPLEEQAREVRSLADLCAGQGANGLRMTLTSFVLAARLEDVAAAASVRLVRMTQGRYSLVHTDGAARGGQRSGLGLLARDGWSGQDRDTSTLSGGETFLASLALALGLADVVTAEAGGSRIGALFVDEGFGTLDEDTLDEVMDVLDGLREGGRVVGLVSHVAELRQRIPAQVQVVKTRAGSDVVLHGC